MPDLASHRFYFVLATLTSLTLSAQSIGTIEGRVTNTVTGEPVGGVKVGIVDRQSHVRYTMTDPTGSYRITALSDGDYRGEFTKDGFSYFGPNQFFGGNPFVHVAGDVPVQVNAQLDPWGSVRGRVADEDGNPAAGVRVQIDPKPIGEFFDDKVTGQNGEFAFQNLAPGSYTVVAKPESKIGMRDGVRVGTVAMYYPSVTELAQAVRIRVRTGEDVSGIEIRLKSVPVYRVAGVILNEAGNPAAHATVKLMGRAAATRQRLSVGIAMSPIVPGANGGMRSFPPATYNILGPGPEPEVARVESRGDGTFEFTAVEPGDWRLNAQAGVADDMPLSGVASAVVSEKDLGDIPIRLTAPFALEVTPDWGNTPAAAARQPANIRLGLTPVDGQPGVTVDDPVKNMRRMNSVFPGRYRVMPEIILGDFYIGSVMWEGRDVSGQVVDLAPGAAPFRVIFKSGLGKVRGRVEKGEGASVFLISHESGDILTYRQKACGAGGAFEIGDVPPGDYYIVAFNRTEMDALPAADLPFAIVPIAASVRVEAGSAAHVDLVLSKWPW